MTEYEYMPVSRRRDNAPFVSGQEEAFVAQSEWEPIKRYYAHEATARAILTREMKRNRDNLAWAKSKGDAKAIAYHDRDYDILRRPVQPWQEYEWERK